MDRVSGFEPEDIGPIPVGGTMNAGTRLREKISQYRYYKPGIMAVVGFVMVTILKQYSPPVASLASVVWALLLFIFSVYTIYGIITSILIIIMYAAYRERFKNNRFMFDLFGIGPKQKS